MRLIKFLPILALSGFLMAADDKAKMTGCLTKNTSGEFTLTDTTGKKVTVMGPADLEKHAANHKVTLHGTEKTTDGKTVFHADRIEHVSNSCEAPTSN